MVGKPFYMSHLEQLVDSYRSTTAAMNQIAEEALKRLNVVKSDIKQLEDGVEDFLRVDKIPQALEFVEAYEKKYLQPTKVCEKPKLEVEGGIGERIAVTYEGYKKALSNYLSANPQDSHIKKEVGEYMRTQVPEDKRINFALITRAMKELGYKVTKDSYVRVRREKIKLKTKEKKQTEDSDISSRVRNYVRVRPSQHEYDPTKIAEHFGIGRLPVYNVLNSIPYLRMRKSKGKKVFVRTPRK